MQEGKIAFSALHGTGQIVQTPQGFMRINPRTDQPELIQAPGGGPLYPQTDRGGATGRRPMLMGPEANANAKALEEKGLSRVVWDEGIDKSATLSRQLSPERRPQKYEQAVRQFAGLHGSEERVGSRDQSE